MPTSSDAAPGAGVPLAPPPLAQVLDAPEGTEELVLGAYVSGSNRKGDVDASNETTADVSMEHVDFRQGFPPPSQLNEAELRLVRSLGQQELISVIDRMAAGSNYQKILSAVEEYRVKVLEEAAESQYATLDAAATDVRGEEVSTEGDVAVAGKRISGASVDRASRMMLERNLAFCGEPTLAVLSSKVQPMKLDRLARMAMVTPLRLQYEERTFLRLLESCLYVSDYTDKVDVLRLSESRARAIGREIKQICAILSGLVVAHQYENGQKLIRDRNFLKNKEFFQIVFEIGRRYKILNPERMRDSYGKLLYMLMDSRKPEIQEMLGFDCVLKVQTVYSTLQKYPKGLLLLQDPLLHRATAEIISAGKTQAQVQREIREKEAAIKALVKKHAATTHVGLRRSIWDSLSRIISRGDRTAGEADEEEEELTPETVEQCIYSLCDHNTFLRFNAEPCEKMIRYLKKYFRPDSHESKFSLAIHAGKDGARLSHDHSRQYQFVLQSLTLWREVLSEMLYLWFLAESDLLSPQNPYMLKDTGQGLNRVQRAPSVHSAMYKIIRSVQAEVKGWCGSDVVHLGDHNVPNAFLFIDKYTQIPRLLGPIVLCLEKVPELYNSNESIQKYIDAEFGSEERLIKLILCDFFRHAFDGSGADNFFDAGSCIDGRLTSAWNWCSMIEKKRYFPAFLLTGFIGFDGRF